MLWVLILLSLILFAFLLVPATRKMTDESIGQSEENLRLYSERCEELAATTDLSDEEKAALQLELDREFLASADASERSRNTGPARRWPLALALLVVVISGTLALYQFWGASNELRTTELLEKSSQVELTKAEQAELTERLAQAAAHDPDNTEWIYLYGRMLTMSGDFAKAADVFADILVQLPQEATEDRAATLTLLAQARFFAADQKADPEIYALLKESLELVPDNRQTQGLAGMLAFELEDYRAAVEHWKTVWLSLPDSPETQMLAQGIRRAAERLQDQGEDMDLGWLKRAQLMVNVDISAEARAAVQDTDTVFVLARAVSGPPMPLAVQRLSVAQLPAQVVLSDAQAMAPGLNLSNHEQVTVIARVSRSGQPVAQSGDWQIQKSPVSNREEKMIQLLISEQVE